MITRKRDDDLRNDRKEGVVVVRRWCDDDNFKVRRRNFLSKPKKRKKKQSYYFLSHTCYSHALELKIFKTKNQHLKKKNNNKNKTLEYIIIFELAFFFLVFNDIEIEQQLIFRKKPLICIHVFSFRVVDF